MQPHVPDLDLSALASLRPMSELRTSSKSMNPTEQRNCAAKLSPVALLTSSSMRRGDRHHEKQPPAGKRRRPRSTEPAFRRGAAQRSTPAARVIAPPPANDDLKPAIVTATSSADTLRDRLEAVQVELWDAQHSVDETQRQASQRVAGGVREPRLA
jgi:hypothetical protein